MSIHLPYHPTIGFQAIGLRRNGDPIWPMIGGAEDDDNGDDDKGSGKGSEDDADASKGDDGDDDKGAAEKKDEKDADKPPAGPDWKARSRQNEAGKKAAEKKLASVLAALGVDDKGDLTPAQLKQKFEDADAETKGLKVENAVIKAASKAGVDADELTDSKRFMSKVADLDPSEASFAKDVKALIDAELKARPSLKIGGVDDKGGKGKGGTGGKESTGNNGKSQLSRADLAKMTPAEIVKAQSEGRLDDVMGKK